MKKSSTTKLDDYELKDEYNLSKMTILPKGRFDPKRRLGKNVVLLALPMASNGSALKPKPSPTAGERHINNGV